jgi:hypothetical protein
MTPETMPNRIYVRPAQAHEGQLVFDWGMENTKGNFDPEVARFKSSITWCAYDKDGPLVFQTIQRPLMLESLAPRPGATKQQIALAMKELTHNAICQAHIMDAGEVYYLGSDEDTDKFSTNRIFEELPYKVFRVKIADLLKRDTECQPSV